MPGAGGLPEVTQQVGADTSRYISEYREALRVTRELDAANRDLARSIGQAQEAAGRGGGAGGAGDADRIRAMNAAIREGLAQAREYGAVTLEQIRKAAGSVDELTAAFSRLTPAQFEALDEAKMRWNEVQAALRAIPAVYGNVQDSAAKVSEETWNQAIAVNSLLDKYANLGKAARLVTPEQDAIASSLGRLTSEAADASESMTVLGRTQGVMADSNRTLLGTARSAGAAVAELNTRLAIGNALMDSVGPRLALIAAGGGGGGGGGFLGGLLGGAGGGGIGTAIFGGALPTVQAAHMITMLTMEVASQVVPAAVAAGAAAAVGYQGGLAAYTRGQGIYTAGEAFGMTYGKTPGQLLGMGAGYQIAQNQATGGVYGIIGSLLQMAGQGTGQGGILGPGGMGVQTVAMIDRGLAGMVSGNRIGALSQALSGGTGALQTIGDIAGNLGDSLLNLAPVLPGMGGVLFGGLKAGTGLLRSVTGLAGGGGLWPLLFGTGLAAEAGGRWGKLALAGGQLPGWLGGARFSGAAGLAERLGLGALPMTADQAAAAAGLSASEYAAIGGGPVAGEGLAGALAGGLGGLSTAGITALLAASAYGISQGTFGTPASNQMSAYMKGINASFGAGSLQPITQALFKAGMTQGNLPGISSETIGGQQAPAGTGIAELMRRGYTRQGALAEIQRQWASNTQNVADQLGKMATAGPAAQKALSDLGVKGATLAQAFGYMTMAMISPQDVGPGGKLDKTATQQLASFLKTYSLMTGGPQTSASALLSAAGADYVMATPQMKSLSQVNQALDSMTQIMTGGPANAAALYQLGAAAPAAVAQAMATAPGGRLTTAQQNQIAQALAGKPGAAHQLVAGALAQGPFTAAGSAAWQAFTNPQTGIIPAAQANMDQLRTFMTMGGISGPQAAQLGAFELRQSVLPYATSPMALAMLQQQAMQAGVPGVMMGQSYAQTRKAIDAHSGTLAQANRIMTRGVQAAADIPAVADFLNPAANVNPLQAALYARIAQAAITTAGAPSRANVSALQSAMGMSGVKPGQMTVGVDAVLQNLHVPAGVMAKVNAELAPAVSRALQAFAPSRELPGGTAGAGKATVTAPPTPHGGAIHYTSTVSAPPTPRGGTIHYTGVVTMSGGPVGSGGGGGGGLPPALHFLAGALPRFHAQHGMLVPGHGSGDTAGPYMLEPGELVVPKHLVPSVTPALTGKIPGLQGGGLIGLGPQMSLGVLPAVLNANFRILEEMIAALAQGGGSGSPYSGGGVAGLWKPAGGSPITHAVAAGVIAALPRITQATHAAAVHSAATASPLPLMPKAAQQVIDAFEKTFKSMGNPWGGFASQVLNSLLDGIKNPAKETAKEAKALTGKVSQEVNFAKSVSAASVSGLNFAGMSNLPVPTTTSGGQPYSYYNDQAALAAGTISSLPVQTQMSDYLQAIHSFGGDVKALAKGGLNKNLLKQLLAAGPLQGDQEAQSILQGPGGIGAVNQLWNQINQASNKLGITGATAVYGQPALKGKAVTVDVHANTAAAQAAIAAIHGKSVTLTVHVNIAGAGGGGGGGSLGPGGTITLDPKTIKAITEQVQAQFLKQAKASGQTGLVLKGYKG